jgi:hypothetical protein
MAKRKHHPEEELPFVALMDTMTNVVGVLIIVLVMMAISLANAVKRVISDLTPATPQQVQQVTQEVEALRAKAKEPASTKPGEEAVMQAKIASLEKELARLKKESESKIGTFADPALQKQEIAHLQAELAEAKEKVAFETKEVAELKAKMTAIPDKKPPPSKIVRLPAPKPLPKDAKMQIVIVNGNGVFAIQETEAKQILINEVHAPPVNQMTKMVKDGRITKSIYDHAKLMGYFGSRKPENASMTLTMLLDKYRRSPGIIPNVKPTALEPLPQALAFNSNFQKAVRNIRNNIPGAVIIFRVAPDGFENYLALRDVVDSMGVPAGWEINPSMSGVGIDVREIQMDQLEAYKKGPSTPQKPKTPSLKLD